MRGQGLPLEGKKLLSFCVKTEVYWCTMCHGKRMVSSRGKKLFCSAVQKQRCNWCSALCLFFLFSSSLSWVSLECCFDHFGPFGSQTNIHKRGTSGIAAIHVPLLLVLEEFPKISISLYAFCYHICLVLIWRSATSSPPLHMIDIRWSV